MISKIKQIWNKYELGFYSSIAGSLAMGTIHLVTTCIDFSWITFNYMLFCYLLMFTRVLLWSLEKKGKTKQIYLFGIMSLMVVLIPLGVSLVKTMLERDAPVYIFDWLIYGYAAYAFTKLIIAIINLAKKKDNAITWISLVGALFTMFMLEFALIKTFSPEGDNSMFITMVISQAVIILVTLFVIGLFIYRLIKNKP